MTAEERGTIAYGYMEEGYNCCQSTVLAFKDLLNMDETDIKLMTSSMGGGVGHLRSVCGVVSGMALVMGKLYGFDNIDPDKKEELNNKVMALGKEFIKQNGSIECGVLTGLSETNDVKIVREDGRDCKSFVGDFAKTLAEYIEAHPYKA